MVGAEARLEVGWGINRRWGDGVSKNNSSLKILCVNESGENPGAGQGCWDERVLNMFKC